MSALSVPLPELCIAPDCYSEAPAHGKFCVRCAEGLAREMAVEVRHIPKYVPTVGFLRDHYGKDFLTKAQAEDVHAHALQLCREYQRGGRIREVPAPPQRALPRVTVLEACCRCLAEMPAELMHAKKAVTVEAGVRTTVETWTCDPCLPRCCFRTDGLTPMCCKRTDREDSLCLDHAIAIKEWSVQRHGEDEDKAELSALLAERAQISKEPKETEYANA